MKAKTIANSRSLLMGIILCFPGLASAQVSGGTPQWSSTAGGPDQINLSNLNVNLSIPVIHRPGRGIDMDLALSYNSAFYEPVTTAGQGKTWTANFPSMGWGLSGGEHNAGYVTASFSNFGCPGTSETTGISTWTNWVLIDLNGKSHFINATLSDTVSNENCPQYANGLTGFSNVAAVDQSGILLSATVNGTRATITVQYPGGSPIALPWSATNNDAVTTNSIYVPWGDLNSNDVIEAYTNGPMYGVINGLWDLTTATGTITDTLGNTVTVASGLDANFGVVSYTNGSGGTDTFTPNWAAYKINTNFGCQYVNEYIGTQGLMSSITLPDGRSYQFQYEPGPSGTVTGRIAKITLPSGGTIAYSYTSANGVSINCLTGSPLGFTRTLSDPLSGQNFTWTYNLTTNGQNENVTTVTNPPIAGASATETYTFEPIPNATGPNYYGTIYADAGIVAKDSSGNILSQTAITYNSQSGNCISNSCPIYYIFQPISARQTTTTIPSGSSSITSNKVDSYSPLGLLTETDVYDFGALGSSQPGALINKTITSYATLYSGVLYDRPQSVTTYRANGTGGFTVTGQTKYGYDETTPTATSGVPQRYDNSPYYQFVGNIGNVTSVQRLVSGTNNFLTTKYTYYDTGNIATSTDPNGAVTSYTYNQCSGSLLGGTSTPVTAAGQSTVTLASSQTINCSTSTVATSTDLNGNLTTNTYSDPYDRVTSVKDAFGNNTSYTYPTSTTNQSTVTSPYSATGVLNNVTTYDGFGRPILQQTLKTSGGASYDSVSAAYNSIGLPSYTSMPYTGTLGQYTITGPGTTTTYDGVGRPLQTTDGGGGYTQYAYSGNDVTVTTGPAPTGESVKVKVLQSDGSGALTSVCEVTTLPGNGACGQTVAQNGYLTTYTRVPGTLTVKQNAQSGSTGVQTRTVNTDLLGRTTSETIPELGSNGTPGTLTYAYDSDPTGKCSGSYPGDLVYKKDAAGNITCLAYDNQHRPLSIAPYTGTGAGPQASVTAQMRYVYDTGSYNGTALQNAMGNLVEAYTCASGSSCTTKLTDEYASTYPETSGSSDTGRLTKQVWESTPNSGGYFTSQETLYPNGVPGLLSASKVGSSTHIYPSLSYTLDSEGRPYTVTDTTNSINLVTATAYAQPTSVSSVSYGNGDVDSYTPDANTGRVTSFKNAIAAGTPFNTAGTLTWNANSTLHQFAWTDSNDATKNQTCTYSSDALNRIATANCGSVWNQTFSYDPFGNITKAANGGTTYNATYNTATNQVVSGVSANYDANGNQTLTGGVSSLTWDANHNPVTAGSTTMTYDALGRLVEFGGNHQVLWGPLGQKLAVYSSSSTLATVALPGGGEAYYTSGALTAVRHKDWLGSSRLATTWAHAVYSKTAYAPFGETYNTAGTSDADFTGKTQDSVATLTDFPYRKFDSSAGRWTAPDPGAWSVVDPTNPQSFNRYAYVMNSPLRNIDPLGLDCIYFNDSGTAAGSIDPTNDQETIDQQSSDCGANGGDWVNGTVLAANIIANNEGGFNVTSSDGTNIYFAVLTAPDSPDNPDGTCFGNCESGYSQHSLANVDSMIVAGSLNDFINWLPMNGTPGHAGAQYPLNPHLGTATNHYCGPNGAGVPGSSNDWACAVHDYNYNRLQVGPLATWDVTLDTWQMIQVQQANQNLCNNVDNSLEGAAIKGFFTGLGMLLGAGCTF